MSRTPRTSEDDRFPFMDLPLLAQEEMFGHMECLEIFDLSVLSKRSARVIQNAQSLISPVSMNLNLYDGKDWSTVEIFSGNNQFPDDNYPRLVWRFCDEPDNESQTKSRNLGGTDVLMSDRSTYCKTQRNVSCPAGRKEISINAVIKHLLSVFSKCSIERIFIQLHGSNRTFIYDTIAGVPRTKRLHILQLARATDHHYVIPRMEITEMYYNWCEHFVGGPTQEDFKFSRDIWITDSSSMNIDLLNINSFTFQLSNSNHSAEEMISFLKKWENSTGDEMKKIALVRIETHRAIGDLDLTELNVKMEGERRYIQRSDGRIGYITQRSPNEFSFEVPQARIDAVTPPVAVSSSPAVVPVPVSASNTNPTADEVYFTLKSSDNRTYKVSKKALEFSGLLTSLVEAGCANSNPIPIDMVKGKTLNKVVRWCERHKNEPIPVRKTPKDVVLSPYDKGFVCVSKMDLFNLICAANFLDIQPLLWITCKKAASFIKRKLPEEIRAIYCIPTDEEDEAAEREAAEARKQEAGMSSGVGSSAV